MAQFTFLEGEDFFQLPDGRIGTTWEGIVKAQSFLRAAGIDLEEQSNTETIDTLTTVWIQQIKVWDGISQVRLQRPLHTRKLQKVAQRVLAPC